MILTLKNIGKIENASIELNGITVIAGENDTGKSTLGKVLFCIFNSFYKIDDQINLERKNLIKSVFDSYYFYNIKKRLFMKKIDSEDIVHYIISNEERYKHNCDLLKNDMKEYIFKHDENFKENFDKDIIINMSDKIFGILSVSDEEILKTVLQKKLEVEFNGQINNIYFENETGYINLNIKNTNVKVTIKEDEVENIQNNLRLNTEVIYIDDPFTVDNLRITPSYLNFNKFTNYESHRKHLELKLMEENNNSIIKDIIVSKKVGKILEKINVICNGEMVKTNSRNFGYKNKNSEAALDIKNISTGLKTFVILKTLLLNGSLEDNGTIVLDEPEIHLHPEWQLLFAELIVLIQKEFGMHILLNTHSPYFLHAIEVYSAKYKVADKCKYYLAENTQRKSTLKDVTTSINEIYEKLSKPFDILESEKYSYD